MSFTGVTSLTQSTEKEDVVAVQDIQQAEDVNIDRFVMYKADFHMKKPSGSDESCNKKENDQENSANDLPGKFYDLNIFGSDLKNRVESKPVKNQLADYLAKSKEKWKDEKKRKISDSGERRNDEEQIKIDEILMLPLKAYRKQCGELHKLLDIDDRALHICDEFDFSDRRRFEIELSKFGGGNPAKIFLESLKLRHGEKSFEDFDRVLKDSKVIWPKLKKTENKDATVLKISQLNHNDIKDLSCILNNDWKSVAKDFGYANEQIEYIARYQMRPNNFSCSESFFRVISQEKPEYSIYEFMYLLLLLKFNDAFEHMKKGVIAWAREKEDIN